MRRFTTILLTVLTLLACQKSELPTPQSAIPEATNISLADLHSLAGDRAIIIDKELIVGGYITSCDKASNFYKTFTIEDATGAMEIMAGLYDLYNIYPKGYYITMRLKGCAIGTHYGVMQAGMPSEPYSYYPTEYFSSRILLDRYVSRYDVRRDIAPAPKHIEELQLSDCGRLVCIGNLSCISTQHPEISDINHEGKWNGYNIFSNPSGATIAVYTSEYATYANSSVPQQRVTISGILQYGTIGSQKMFMIKMRDENDCSSNK